MYGKNSTKTVLRTVISCLAVFVCTQLQVCVFPYLRFFGCIPDVTAACLICLTLFENEKTVCVLAVCSGVILHSVGTWGVSYYPLLYLFAVCLCMVLSNVFFKNGFLSVMTAAVCTFAVEGILTSVFLMSDGASYADAFTGAVLPQLAYSLACTAAVYPLCKLHGIVFGIRRKADYYEE